MENHVNTELQQLSDQRIRPQLREPPPICTIMADASVRLIQQQNIGLLDLQRLLLNAVGIVAQQMVERAVRLEGILRLVKDRYQLEPVTERQITELLGPPPNASTGEGPNQWPSPQPNADR